MSSLLSENCLPDRGTSRHCNIYRRIIWLYAEEILFTAQPSASCLLVAALTHLLTQNYYLLVHFVKCVLSNITTTSIVLSAYFLYHLIVRCAAFHSIQSNRLLASPQRKCFYAKSQSKYDVEYMAPNHCKYCILSDTPTHTIGYILWCYFSGTPQSFFIFVILSNLIIIILSFFFFTYYVYTWKALHPTHVMYDVGTARNRKIQCRA